MIYSVRTTSLGIEKVSSWDGDNAKSLNYLEATILACAVEGPALHTLEAALNSEYPFEITTGHLVDKVQGLERLGFLSVLREIADDALIEIQIDGQMSVKTMLSDFVARNMTKGLNFNATLSSVKDKLLQTGAYEGYVNRLSIKARLAR